MVPTATARSVRIFRRGGSLRGPRGSPAPAMLADREQEEDFQRFLRRVDDISKCPAGEPAVPGCLRPGDSAGARWGPEAVGHPRFRRMGYQGLKEKGREQKESRKRMENRRIPALPFRVCFM